MLSDDGLHEKLLSVIDRDYAAALLKGAVGRASVTGDEANFVDYLHQHMSALDLSPKTADFLHGRPNIWGTRSGLGKGPNLLFIGHTDTVHTRGWEERWAGDARADPFGGAIIDGEMWGRGTGDLKAGICASLAAIDLLDKADIKLRGDLSFAFIGDEESGEPNTGISAGIKDYIARTHAGEIQKPDFAVYVEPTKLAVYTAQMGFFIAEITITGKSAYFGVPEQGVDALKASHKALTAIWDHSRVISQKASHPLVGRAFALVTEIKGGGYIAVPGKCSLSLIRKLLPGEDLDAAVKALEGIILDALKDENVQTGFAYPAGRDHKYGGTPAQIDQTLPEISALVKTLQDVSPEHGPEGGSEYGPKYGEVAGAPYWSEASFLINQMDCPAVYCAPGDITNCHTLEERVNVDEYVAGIIAFAGFIASYCGTMNT